MILDELYRDRNLQYKMFLLNQTWNGKLHGCLWFTIQNVPIKSFIMIEEYKTICNLQYKMFLLNQ